MRDWFARQYADIRGNLKWWIVASIFWLLYSYARKILGAIPHVPWWLNDVILFLVFVSAFVWLVNRITKAATTQVLHEKTDPVSPPLANPKSDMERWCEALVHNDKVNMHQRVIAVSWEPRRIIQPPNFYIEFKITFVNASIFELRSPKLGGIIKFDRHPLPFPPQFDQAFPLNRGQKTWISIRQPLTKEIAENIQARLNRDGVTVDFDFGDLEITFDAVFYTQAIWQWAWKGRDSVSVKTVTLSQP